MVDKLKKKKFFGLFFCGEDLRHWSASVSSSSILQGIHRGDGIGYALVQYSWGHVANLSNCVNTKRIRRVVDSVSYRPWFSIIACLVSWREFLSACDAQKAQCFSACVLGKVNWEEYPSEPITLSAGRHAFVFARSHRYSLLNPVRYTASTSVLIMKGK